jgi:hypothetical protein
MSDKPEQPRFSSAQIAMAGLGAALVLIVIVMMIALWNSMSG